MLNGGELALPEHDVSFTYFPETLATWGGVCAAAGAEAGGSATLGLEGSSKELLQSFFKVFQYSRSGQGTEHHHHVLTSHQPLHLTVS